MEPLRIHMHILCNFSSYCSDSWYHHTSEAQSEYNWHDSASKFSASLKKR